MNRERIAGLLAPRRLPWLGAGLAILLAGCGTDSRVHNEPSPDLPTTPGVMERSDRGQRLPSPDAAEIKFNADTQTLTLNEPPVGRWMVHLPNEKAAVPVVREFKVPDGVDTDKTLIYYAQPGGRQSKVVTLTDVQRAAESYTSRVP